MDMLDHIIPLPGLEIRTIPKWVKPPETAIISASDWRKPVLERLAGQSMRGNCQDDVYNSSKIFSTVLVTH